MHRPKSKKTEEGLRGKFEPVVAKILKHHQPKSKYDILYESETFEVQIPVKYTPDFVLEYPDGVVKIIECKGYFDDNDRKKILRFREQYPEIDFLIVFQRDNPVRSSSKTFRYSDWCNKHNIRYSIASIPEDFLNG